MNERVVSAFPCLLLFVLRCLLSARNTVCPMVCYHYIARWNGDPKIQRFGSQGPNRVVLHPDGFDA